MRYKLIEIWVGLFIFLSILAFSLLAIKVSGLSDFISHDSYILTATFDNLGGLKVRAPVMLAGVKIGQVSSIKLDNNQFKAVVSMNIDSDQQNLPIDTSASILTQGLLGANYIALNPGFEHEFLKHGAEIAETHSALVLEELIGQFLFSFKHSERGK